MSAFINIAHTIKEPKFEMDIFYTELPKKQRIFHDKNSSFDICCYVVGYFISSKFVQKQTTLNKIRFKVKCFQKLEICDSYVCSCVRQSRACCPDDCRRWITRHVLDEQASVHLLLPVRSTISSSRFPPDGQKWKSDQVDILSHFKFELQSKDVILSKYLETKKNM